MTPPDLLLTAVILIMFAGLMLEDSYEYLSGILLLCAALCFYMLSTI